MNIRTLAVNAVLAALYIAVTMIVQPIAFSNIQFRIPEMFNHLIVYNKKYFIGIVIGVFLSNLFFSPIVAYDLVFGVGQSILALTIMITISRFVHNIRTRMAINIVVFTFTMFLIALELNIAAKAPFLITWAATAAGEFVVMLVGAPIIHALNKRINFSKLI